MHLTKNKRPMFLSTPIPMIKIKKLLLTGCMAFICLIAYSSQASAGQSAEMLCVNGDTANNKSQEADKCATYELHVSITADQDTGQRGAYGIFAISENPSRVAYWTEEKGWSPYSDVELIKPTEISLKKLDVKREYVVFKGSHENFCKLSNGYNINLFAWRVTLNPVEIKKYASFLKRFDITGWQAENFMNSILFYQANVQKKIGLVYSNTCPPSK